METEKNKLNIQNYKNDNKSSTVPNTNLISTADEIDGLLDGGRVWRHSLRIVMNSESCLTLIKRSVKQIVILSIVANVICVALFLPVYIVYVVLSIPL